MTSRCDNLIPCVPPVQATQAGVFKSHTSSTDHMCIASWASAWPPPSTCTSSPRRCAQITRSQWNCVHMVHGYSESSG